MATDDTTTKTSGNPNPDAVNEREKLEADTFRKMLDVLDSLLSHNHTFTDDYGSACQCTCNCQCNGRGAF